MHTPTEGEASGHARAGQLVTRSQNGDPTAFEQLYRETVGRVYALCLRLSADRVRAEELTQAVFVQVWKSIRSFRGDSLFSTWLHGVAVNVVLAERRAEERRTARVTVTDDPMWLENATTETLGIRIDLERAIASLPAGARTVFVLHDIEGYLHDEIAELTGMSSGTSKAQLHRARKLLREALDR
jgi:RNA polymerase sigma-70 factor (ECF subfamily)